MPSGHECYHCKQWIAAGEAHDCWTTTEAALTKDLSEDLQDAYARIRESAVELGEQRIYASHHCIMFSRKVCYFFVRPKRSYLELCVFLGRPLKSPLVARVINPDKAKVAHIVRIQHRDQVETPITDWLREAYAREDVIAAAKATGKPKGLPPHSRTRAKSRTRTKKKRTR